MAPWDGLLAAYGPMPWNDCETVFAAGYILLALGIVAISHRVKQAKFPRFRWLCVVFALFVLAIGPRSWMGPAVAAIGFAGMAWGYLRCARLFTRMTFADTTATGLSRRGAAGSRWRSARRRPRRTRGSRPRRGAGSGSTERRT